jgi:hypothetical protein
MIKFTSLIHTTLYIQLIIINLFKTLFIHHSNYKDCLNSKTLFIKT